MHEQRIQFSEWAMRLAETTSLRATCVRRRVGCVLLNERRHVLATGYNGVHAGAVHCNSAALVDGERVFPHACPAAFLPSGQGLDGCHAIHAEQNALLQCHDVYSIYAAFVTTAPCVTCTKLLLNTSCELIVFRGDYPHSEASAALWQGAGRQWTQMSVIR